MNRRLFLSVVGIGTSEWWIVARAQQPVRRIAVFSHQAARDPESQLYVAALVQALEALGWGVGRNIDIQYRWADSDPDRRNAYAAELAKLSPEVVLVAGGLQLRALQRANGTVPIVFVQVADAVGGGYVNSLARPGRSATGFTNFDYNFSAKWLELLKLIAPRLSRVAVLQDFSNPSGPGQVTAVQAAARSLSVQVVPVSLRDVDEMERAIDAFAQQPGGGLIVTPSSLAIDRRDVVISLANRRSLPAIYPFRYFAVGGGLISYGPDVADQWRRAASYIDRILKGAKPADLPVQESSKIEMVINLRTAKTLGVTIPQSLLARADDVIQ